MDKSTKEIRVAIIVDPSGLNELDDEIKNIIFALDNFQLPFKLVVFGESPIILKDQNVDMVIIDYGGMSVMGGWDTARANIGYVCQWAEDHPSKIALIWTTFTAQVYFDELEDEFGGLNNILFRFPHDPFHLFLGDTEREEKHHQELRETLKIWFGVEDKPIETHKLIVPGRKDEY